MKSEIYYAISETITDLGEDVIQYIEFSSELFLRQVNMITSDCPYTGFSRAGMLINTEMDKDIRVVGYPVDYPILSEHKIPGEVFLNRWNESNKESNLKIYSSQKKTVENERLKVDELIKTSR